MRSLFVKVFLWFWVATILSGLVFFIIGFATRPGGPPEFRGPAVDQWRRLSGQTLTLYGQTAAALLERDGRAALDDHTALLERTTGIRVVLFLRQNEAIFDRGASPEAQRLAAHAAETGGPEMDVSGKIPLLATRIGGPGGSQSVVVGEFPEPPGGLRPQPREGGGESPPPIQGFPRGLLAEFGRFTRGLGVHSLVTFVIGGLVCLGLAWHLTAPIRRLRTAAQRLAGGDLAARVGPGHGRGADEIAALGRDFDLMAERIETLMTTQRQLLRDISHELRSPLARLNVALELARQRSGPGSGAALDRIEREANRLNNLIGQLLTLTQLESGGDWIQRGPVSLKGLVESIASDANFEAQTQNQVVHAVVEEEVIIHGSEEMLRQGIENVVRNAVRYTAEQTQVEISVSRRRGGSDDAAIIRVRDRGPGVPEHALPRLFLPFYRVADARDRQTGGTGIGLAITQRAVHLHGGTVIAANAPDGGLIVEIVLPVTATPPPAGA